MHCFDQNYGRSVLYDQVFRKTTADKVDHPSYPETSHDTRLMIVVAYFVNNFVGYSFTLDSVSNKGNEKQICYSTQYSSM